MKCNDTGEFCVLYVEPADNRAALFTTLTGQKKPVVIMLAEQAQAFQRPDDFSALKHLKRQLDLSIIFIIAGSELLMQMAGRYGFPVYLSMEALANALAAGQLARQRVLNRATVPLTSGGQSAPVPSPFSPKKTVPLSSRDSGVVLRTTLPLAEPESRVPRISRPLASSPQHAAIGSSQRPSESGSPPAANKGQADERVPRGIWGGGVGAVMQGEEAHTPNRSEFVLPGPQPVTSMQAHTASSATLPGSRPTPPPVVWPEKPPLYAQPRKKRFVPASLVVLTTIGLLLAGIGSFLVLFNKLPASDATASAAVPTVMGHVTFLSSDQLSENSSQGISDQVLIDLSNLAAPAPHTVYYAWLLGDKSVGDPPSFALGQLNVVNGKAHLLYPGDAHHTNLLQVASRFLVTQEDTAVPPISPTPDLTAWRYYAEFSQTPLPAGMVMSGMGSATSFSYLDHLRHLLAADPLLDQLELPGGLNSWFFTNTGKVLEWTGSMRQAWEDSTDIAFVRRQAVRTLAYLDGLSFVKQDLPQNVPLGINERLAGIGLLQVNGANQDPPSYMAEIVHHLSGLLQASDMPADLRKTETDLLTAMNNVQFWLSQVRRGALQMLKMSDQQLRQPATLSLINDMIDNANHAYVGLVDPTSGEMRQGVIWIHEHMQSLAVLSITPYMSNKSSIQMIPDTNHMHA